MSGSFGFLASNTHLARGNTKFQTDIKPECGKDLFLSSPEFKGKISDRNRIIKFNQTSQKHFAPRNVLNKQKIDASAYMISGQHLHTLKCEETK